MLPRSEETDGCRGFKDLVDQLTGDVWSSAVHGYLDADIVKDQLHGLHAQQALRQDRHRLPSTAFHLAASASVAYDAAKVTLDLALVAHGEVLHALCLRHGQRAGLW